MKDMDFFSEEEIDACFQAAIEKVCAKPMQERLLSLKRAGVPADEDTVSNEILDKYDEQISREAKRQIVERLVDKCVAEGLMERSADGRFRTIRV